jgi:DNA-binding response OmpR family regulator
MLSYLKARDVKMKNGISDIDLTVRAARPLQPGYVHQGRQGLSPSPKYQTAKILAVDDNIVVATLLAITLKASGHVVTSVFNGGDAIAHLQMEVFDMVILDLHLPDYSGFQVLEIIRTQRLCPRTPVIIVSSSDEIYDVSRARHLGAAGYFAKVVSPETLPDKIEQILTNRDMIWIDDYHRVTDAAAHRLQHLPRREAYPRTPKPRRTIRE